ncbi:MAG: shikimate kinase, partial [Terriglobales bacterium]
MGSGKTTVGQELARQLPATFLDLDRVIEKREGQSVSHIFARLGEDSFRAAERAAVVELLAGAPANCVLATGGGAFPQAQIADLLEARSAITIFLDAPAEELHRRCVDSLDAGARPLLKDLSSFKKLYAERL